MCLGCMFGIHLILQVQDSSVCAVQISKQWQPGTSHLLGFIF